MACRESGIGPRLLLVVWVEAAICPPRARGACPARGQYPLTKPRAPPKEAVRLFRRKPNIDESRRRAKKELSKGSSKPIRARLLEKEIIQTRDARLNKISASARTKSWAEAVSGNARAFSVHGTWGPLGRRVRVMARGRYYFPVARAPPPKEAIQLFRRCAEYR